MNRVIRAFVLAMILLGLTATRAQTTALTVAGSDITIEPGATATMALTITSDSSDTLSAFGIQLLITPLNGAPELLQFTTASDPYGNPNYVFYNESLGADIPIPFWSLPYKTNYSSDTILGGDSDDGTGATPNYVTIPSVAGEAHTYLATVQFQLAATAPLGALYQVSLVTGPNTYFDDQNGNPLGNPVSLEVGTVTSVPEPSALSLMGISSLCGPLCLGRSRRRDER